jgi:lipoprotein NlpD
MEGINQGLIGRIHIRKQLVHIWLILLAAIFFCSCSVPSPYVRKEPAKGIYHRVKKGETIRSIALAYHIKIQDLAEINNISNPGLIEEGSVVFIPDATEVIDDVIISARKMDVDTKSSTKVKKSVKVQKPSERANEDINGSEKKASPSSAATEKEKIARLTPPDDASAPAPIVRKPPEEKPEPKTKSAVEEKEDIQFDKRRFIWPLRGSVKTRFGIQPNKTYHNWIKIVSAAETPVKAAAAGIVIFSAQLKDYGETIIVRHENGYATVYTHLKKRYVKTDQKIKKGDVIANIGEKDEAGDAYMNFEVRLHGKARNPLFFLP